MTDSSDDIPAHILRFLEANIDSVPQIETLLMMFAQPERDWFVNEIAARNYTTEQRAIEALSALERRGLVTREDPPVRFRFRHGTDETQALIGELEQCYRKNLSRMTMIIHSKPSASIQEFARAFDLKKDR